MCEILGVNYAEIEAEAVRTLTQPKSWGLPPEEEPSRELPTESPVAAAVADPPSAGCVEVEAYKDSHKPRARGKVARTKRPRRDKSRRNRKRVRAA